MSKRIGVLLSGRGSNLKALLEAQGALGAYEIVVAITNTPGAGGLAIAEAAGVETVVIDHRPFGKDREAFERELDAALRARDVEIVALAGFMRVLTPFFVRAWAGRLINIHPSLLPAFPGRDTHARALAARVKLHGCTVHLVTDTVDDGPIIGQAALAVSPADTAETLESSVLALEHTLYPRALAHFITGGETMLSDDGMLLGAHARADEPRSS